MWKMDFLYIFLSHQTYSIAMVIVQSASGATTWSFRAQFSGDFLAMFALLIEKKRQVTQ